MGEYPTQQEGLEALNRNPGDDKWKGPYLVEKGLPKDPWGNEYHYENPGQHGEVDVFSYGKDGRSGGEGENKDIVSWE